MNLEDAKRIKNLMRTLREADTNFRVYGAGRHKYRWGPTLSEAELQAFEAQYGIKLPEDYRFFLKEVGQGNANPNYPSNYVGANSGAGPGNGLMALNEAVLACDLGKPFPLTESTEAHPCAEAENWGDKEPYPGVLEICYRGSAIFDYLVVNGPTYGTVWNLDWHFYPTGLSFEKWYRKWTDGLVTYALPILKHEHAIEGKIKVGLTKAEVISICGGNWKLRPFSEKRTDLSFEHLRTEFELDENEKVVRIINYSL